MLPFGVNHTPRPKLSEAIAVIRRQGASGSIRPSREAQKGIDRLGHDIGFVNSLLSECTEAECRNDFPSKHRPDVHLYEFLIEIEEEYGDLTLYVKVAVYIPEMGQAELWSYKIDGSPQ